MKTNLSGIRMFGQIVEMSAQSRVYEIHFRRYLIC